MKKAALILGVLLLIAAPVYATTLLWMDVQDLTRNSTSVVTGKVAAQFTLADKPGVTLNQVILEIGEALKGDLAGSVLVNNPGFQGAPVFAEGDELVLFISTRNGTNVITGFQQGSFKIVEDGTGRKVLNRGVPSRDKAIAGTRSVDSLLHAIRNASE